MKSDEEEGLLADLYIDLKGAKQKRDDWIEIAKKCQKLANHYKSTKVAAQKLGVSYSLLRTIIRLLELPQEVQRLVKTKRILYDAAQELLADGRGRASILNISRPSGLGIAIDSGGATFSTWTPPAPVLSEWQFEGNLQSVIGRVNKPKPEAEKIRVAVIPLREDTYSSLHAFGAKRKISVEKVILGIIDEWKEGQRVTA